MSNRAPFIGVTSTLKEDTETVADRPLGTYIRADFDYVSGVAAAGGVPLVLPTVGGTEFAEDIVCGLDGLVLTGGADIEPRHYGEEPLPELEVTLPERDELEISLAKYALRHGVPIFGICRGMQLMNVVLGGTLYQDIRTQRSRDAGMHSQTTPKWQPSHEVEFSGDSGIASSLGSSCVRVNSYHHQGIKDLAEGIVVTGRSSDGVVEAVEGSDSLGVWFYGIQWHAEAMRERYPEHGNLFGAHVEAARRYSLRRAAA